MDTIQPAAGGHASPAPPLHPDTPAWLSIGSGGAEYDSFQPQPALLPLAPASSRLQKHAHKANLPTATTILPKRRRIKTEYLSPQPGSNHVFACGPVDPRLVLSPAPLYDMGPDIGSVVSKPGAEMLESPFRDRMVSQETMAIINPAELTLLSQPQHLHRPTLEAPVVSIDSPAEMTGFD
jgi:hypothetical protein